jgi:lipid-binding SYLF domain-containing protein
MKPVMFNKFAAFGAALTLVLAMAPFGMAQAKTAKEIDTEVDAALGRFHKEVKGADEYMKAAKAVLVIPQVTSVGLIVGGKYGEGALRVGGKTKDYYKLETGSLGFQAGYKTADMVLVFLTDEALGKFYAGEGWSVGAESGITVVDESVAGDVDTLKGKASILSFTYGGKGLMGGLSLKGSKFTKFRPGEATK